MRETSQAINLLLFFPSLCWKNGYFLQFFPQSSRPRLAPSSNRLHCCASVHFIWLQSGRRRPISDTAELRSYLPRRRHCQHDRITQVSRLNQQRSCDSFFPDRRLDRLSVLSLSRRSARSTKPIFLAAVLTIIGQILQVAAYHLVQFVVGRIILGIGIGEISVEVPIWLSKCSPASHRG